MIGCPTHMIMTVLRHGSEGSRMKTLGKVHSITGPSLAPDYSPGSLSNRPHEVMFFVEFTRGQFRSLMKAKMSYTRYFHLVLYDSDRTTLSFTGQIADLTDIQESEDIATANITIEILGSVEINQRKGSQHRRKMTDDRMRAHT